MQIFTCIHCLSPWSKKTKSIDFKCTRLTAAWWRGRVIGVCRIQRNNATFIRHGYNAGLNLPVRLVESDDKDRNWKFLLGEYCRIIINESIPTMKKKLRMCWQVIQEERCYWFLDYSHQQMTRTWEDLLPAVSSSPQNVDLSRREQSTELLWLSNHPV